jgi:translation initiation factor IF-2
VVIVKGGPAVPTRIYQIAKDLKIDSKELVDICTKAGITGKGSALASLEDAEVEKLKAYLAGPKKAPPPAAAPVAPPVEPVRPPAPVTTSASSASGEATVTVLPPAPVPDESAAYSRNDYIGPGSSGKIRIISSKPKSGQVRTEVDDGTKRKKREPVINLAKLPDVKQPGPKESTEPAPQKPEIRLPKDAIVGTKKGVKPKLDELAKSVEKGKSPLAGRGNLVPKKDKDRPHDAAVAAPLSSKVGAKRGKPKTREEEAEEAKNPNLAGLASARADRQKARKSRQKDRVETVATEEDSLQLRRRRTLSRRGTNTAAPRKGRVALELPCTVRSFSEAAGVTASQVQKALMALGVMATINAKIDGAYVELLATELGVELEFKAKESLEDSVLKELDESEESPEQLQPRPPIVTLMGHVDHGKTSLLDRMIGTNIVAGEAGGITQHIRAFKINRNGREVSFVDTPGHAAFTEMRARGANVTDIVVLVVAADDGVMPQTEEAISHARAAEVPIVVAMNKMDVPGANANRVLQQLSAKNLLPSEWGGDVEVVRTSAVKGEGIDELVDTLLTIAELHELKANPNKQAVGTCLEAEQQGGRGVLAKVMVQQGTLRVGDIVVCGPGHGRIKAMYDTLRTNERVEEAGPSTPVTISGLDVPPNAGDRFYVLDDIAQAREIAERRAEKTHAEGLGGSVKVSFDRFQDLLTSGKLGQTDEFATLNLIVRADVQGSIEAILKELEKLQHPEVQIKILQTAVGGITAADVQLANASNAVIIGFNVIPDEAARVLAEEHQIEVRRYEVIYKLTDDIKAILEGKLKPEERIVELGRAVVKQTFSISRVGTVAGCYVAAGTIERGCRIRVNRDGRTIGDYAIDSLKREKDDAREVQRGMECGIRLAGFNDVKKDDILEAYKIEEFARTL